MVFPFLFFWFLVPLFVCLQQLDTLRSALAVGVAHDARLGAEELVERVLCRCGKESARLLWHQCRFTLQRIGELGVLQEHLTRHEVLAQVDGGVCHLLLRYRKLHKVAESQRH